MYLCMMFNRFPFVNVINIHSRDTPLDSLMVDCDKDFLVIVASGTSSSLSPQDLIEVDGRLFRLVYVLEDELNSKFFFRYKYCKIWWNVCNPGRPVDTCETAISNLLQRNSCKIAIFEKVESDLSMKEKNRSISNIFGQTLACCSQHQFPLAWDFPKIRISVNLTNTVPVNLLGDVSKKIVKVPCVNHICKTSMKNFSSFLLQEKI